MRWKQESKNPLTIPSELVKELTRIRGQSKEIRIEITPVYEGRTLPQNALFHVNLKKICKVTGMKLEDLKKEVKRNALSFGYPFQRDYDGEVVIKDGEVVPISTAEATIADFKILFYALDDWLMENGVDMEVIWE